MLGTARSKTNENNVRLPCILMNGLLESTAVLCHLTRMIGDENTVDRSFQRFSGGPHSLPATLFAWQWYMKDYLVPGNDDTHVFGGDDQG
jgi:hypothetical protein